MAWAQQVANLIEQTLDSENSETILFFLIWGLDFKEGGHAVSALSEIDKSGWKWWGAFGGEIRVFFSDLRKERSKVKGQIHQNQELGNIKSKEKQRQLNQVGSICK